ncbi:MAG: hypothetical protein GX227_06210 [Clostridiaceae bacterium]|jgi:hypothetical protein|nr:hypothetical protein [Clostridiaceae bacterium]
MTNELEERKRRRKKKRNRRRLLGLLGFILMLVYIPAIWKWLFSVNHEIGVVRTATLEVKAPLEGILIRNETTLKSPGTGIIIPTINNGERVAKSREVASFIQSNMRDVVENYRQMEIDILKRVVSEFDSASGTQRELWKAAIETQIKRLTDLSNSGDLSEAEDIRGSVDRVLEVRARYMLENDVLKDKLKEEKKELERLRSNVQKSVESIVSSKSGVVLYKCDGSEEKYTQENRYSITLEDIEKAVTEPINAEKSLTPAEISVKENELFGKIISNDKCWITFRIPEKQGAEISVLYEKARLNEKEISFEIEVEGIEERIPVTIEKIGDKNKDFQIFTASMTKHIESTMDHRSVKGNLFIKSITGMKVPIRSLFNVNEVDDTADLAILRMNKVKFVRVQIAARQDNYAIIDNIDTTDTENSVNIFDIYLVNPKNIVEGQVIDK